MANINFVIPDDQIERFVDGMAAHYGYKAVNELTDEVNPETKAQYVRRKIRQEWIHRVKRAELKAAHDAVQIGDDIDVQG